MTPTQIKKGHVPKILLNSLITEGTDNDGKTCSYKNLTHKALRSPVKIHLHLYDLELPALLFVFFTI